MADRPIIFSAPMVRALLAGRKTQTRRLIKPQPCAEAVSAQRVSTEKATGRAVFNYYNHRGEPIYAVPAEGGFAGEYRAAYGVGDRLYVREHWKTDCRYDAEAPRELSTNAPILTLADSTVHTRAFAKEWGKHRQGMHMPRWASRLWLAVTDVRVQRLQECSESDAIAEGLIPVTRKFPPMQGCAGALRERTIYEWDSGWSESPVPAYAALWNSLHTAEGTTWDANPWVVAVSFDVHRGNIDAEAAHG